MVTEQALMNAYKATPLGPDSFEFEVHREWYLRELRERINDRTFEPTTYTFITEVPRPREVIACDAGTRTNDHYIGQCKTCNGYARMKDLLDKINPEWWNYTKFNEDRLCIQALPGYGHRERIEAKYHIKPSSHDRRKRHQRNAS